MSGSTVIEHETSINSDYPNGLRAFTFWICETLYAVDISKVLTISQDVNNIQIFPAEKNGLLGMVEFQNHAIPVIDFANFLRLESGSEAGDKLIKMFEEQENLHLEWINALEHSIKTGDTFTKQTDPDKCSFSSWYKTLKFRDETLMMMMKDFDEPHRRIHALAETLLSLRNNGKKDEALKRLEFEKKITLKKLTRYFTAAKEQIIDASRAVLLYVTEDGQSPAVALRIDEIHEVIDFKPEQFKTMKSLKSLFKADEAKLITHYIKRDNSADCLLVNATKLIESIKDD